MTNFFNICNILLITILLYFCTGAFYKITKSIFGQHIQSHASHTYGPKQYSKQLKPMSRYDAITDRNLFNTAGNSSQISVLPDTDNLPETSLKLKLWGTVVGSHEKAYAVIEETESKIQNLYREGDNIQQATVKRILREMVILRIDGKDEILEMEAALKDKLAAALPLSNDETSVEDEQNVNVDRVLLNEVIENRTFLKYARIRPDFSNSNALGLKVSQIDPDSIIPLLGIKEGDIITALDGKKFRKTNEVIDYYKSIPSSSGMDIEVFRNGKKITLHYDFQ
jgi:general secretion pathway protein C